MLKLIATGHTNSEAAGVLGIAVRTIEAHRARILDELGLHTRAELVRHAVDQRLIETETLPAAGVPSAAVSYLEGS